MTTGLESTIKIRDRLIGHAHPAYCIAELGINHNGDLTLAKRLIDAAAFAGCEAVKTQARTPDAIYTAEELAAPLPPEPPPPNGWQTRGDYVHGREFSAEQHAELADYAHGKGLAYGVSCWDVESVGRVWAACDFHKVASPMLTHADLLKAITEIACVPAILSTGMSGLEQVDHAIAYVASSVALLHCVSAYPASFDALNLACISTLRERYGVPVGYCVVPETRVLDTNLRWRRAGDLSVGDEIVAFDEHISADAKMRRAVVTANRETVLPCMAIETDRGSITASHDHRFVVSRFVPYRNPATGSRGGAWRSLWVRAEEIRAGDRVRHFVTPWTEEQSYDAGWLAGMFDGEGWLGGSSRKPRPRDSGQHHRYAALAQNPGPVLESVVALLSDRGFRVRPRRQQPDPARPSYNCREIAIGGRRETLRLLGTIRPQRLLAKSSSIWEGTRTWSTDSFAAVLSVAHVGPRSVAAVTTSTGTLITEGFLSHNSGHEYGIAVSTCAVAMGACIVERHLTLDRAMWGSDQAMSLEPGGMLAMVRDIRAFERARGDGVKRVHASELGPMRRLRRPA